MTKVVIILDEHGCYTSAYADSEVDVRVLQRGKTPEEDSAIDRAEAELEECE